MKEILSPRDRVLNTLKRLPVDRCPCDIWHTDEVLDSLLLHFDTRDPFQVYEALGVDKILFLEAPPRGFPKVEGGLSTTIWGSKVQRVKQDAGAYEETVFYPLSGLEDPHLLEDYPWPRAADFDYRALHASCIAGGRYARMLSFVSIFEIYCKLKPMDQALMDLYLNGDLARRIIAILLEFQKDYIRRAVAACGKDLDLVYLSDDMGMQDRLLMGFPLWEEYFKGPYEELIDLIHSLGLYAFYHSDGAAYEVLEAMVKLGVDLINPIQYRCPGMERERLKANLGDRVVFHGAVENQHILPFGSPEEVAQEVRDDIRILGSGGGYICAPCHNLQAGTPLENILALYRTVRHISPGLGPWPEG